jgi:hypothetical protein
VVERSKGGDCFTNSKKRAQRFRPHGCRLGHWSRSLLDTQVRHHLVEIQAELRSGDQIDRA